MEYPPTTQELQDRVRRQMLDEARRQADRVNENAGRVCEGATRQVTAATPGVQGAPKCSGVRLAWVNPAAIEKRANKRTPFPMIKGGKR
ncbi:hypothetical protein VE26_05440 [Devosia chinhatensis]|uniref:Uncharacterized protein n=1 Tax=Devosia chinhatensis TaxID=429727 RepID=A0A0F5FME4_9HYPH|nr:hypothetical protein VE26_05440 [Devosia chinhatensis]